MSQEYFIELTNGEQIYAKDRDGHEIYPQTGETFIYSRKLGRHVYAKSSQGHEYYPNLEVEFIRDKDGIFLYAVSSFGDIFFPIADDGAEYYLRGDTDSDLPALEKVLHPRYATTFENVDIYPKKNYNGSEVEVTLRNEYALDVYNMPKYPLDENGNEYFDFQVPLDHRRPLHYPITNNNFYIIPSEDGVVPLFLPFLKPHLKESDIVGVIKQLKYKSFLTNVRSLPRTSRAPTQKRYDIYPVKKSRNSWYGTILWILVVFLVGLFIVYFNNK